MRTGEQARPGNAVVGAMLVAVLLLPVAGCGARQPDDLADGAARDTIDYRLVTRDDFQSPTSNSVWGNFAHGAEICTTILPRDDYAVTGRFRAVMKPECSFWNRTIGPLGFIGRLLALATGVPAVVPVKQPDWYILQHEQVHFAIMQVAALTLSEQIERVPPSQRTPRLVDRAYALTLQHAQDRHDAFDRETSGRFDPTQLEKWVRVLERQMADLCASDPGCAVRTASR